MQSGVLIDAARFGFEVLVAGRFGVDEVLLAFAKTGLRLEAHAAAEVAAAWSRRRREAARSSFPLYNGQLWRVESYRLKQGRMALTLGRTTYREYVGTREPGFAGSRDRSQLSNPLAVCAAVVTGDNQVVVARREGVDVGEGMYGVPGGFVERDKDANPFWAMAREVLEELGISLRVADFVCNGLIFDLKHPHYELCFETRVDQPLADLTRITPRERESGILEGVPDSEQAVKRFLDEHAEVISPTAAGCLALYARHRTSLRL